MTFPSAKVTITSTGAAAAMAINAAMMGTLESILKRCLIMFFWHGFLKVYGNKSRVDDGKARLYSQIRLVRIHTSSVFVI